MKLDKFALSYQWLIKLNFMLHSYNFNNAALRWAVLFSLLWVGAFTIPLAAQQQYSDIDDEIAAAVAVRLSDPARSSRLLDRLYEEMIASGDSLKAVSILVEQAETFGNQANYKEAYDRLWKALLIADEAGLAGASASVHIYIGRYYSFYKRREQAIDYFQKALAINQRRVAGGEAPASVLSDNYYAFAATFRELNEPGNAQRYLDSTLIYFDPTSTIINQAYLDFETAFSLAQQSEYREAIKRYQLTVPWFQKNNPGYLTLVFTYLGDAHYAIEDFSESETSYLKALNASSINNSHIDFSPLIYERLSKLYLHTGRHEEAYENLKQYSELDNQFFDSRSESSRPLLEIQDAFRQEMQARQERERQERIAQLENEEKVSFLKLTILVISIALILVAAFFYFKYVRARHHAEKQMIRKERELEVQKANEIVQLKNKELAASTLKLIARDEFIEGIKEKLERNNDVVSANDLKTIVRSIKATTNNDQNWEEFEARFVAVNKDFYTMLKSKFPKLTQGDLKLCALIKLNFSSKDIARLMGISVESVHTTRYRLRKKIGLVNKENLVEFIAGI